MLVKDNIRQKRKELGLTYEELGKNVGLINQQYGNGS